MYRVQPLQTTEEITTSLSIDLRTKGIGYQKTVIFFWKLVHRLFSTTCIYEHQEGVRAYPQNYPDVHKYHLVDLYTRGSTVCMREKVLTSFAKSGSTLRLIIATTAFGMGLTAKVSGMSYTGVSLVMLKNMFRKQEGQDVMDYK